VRYGPDEVAGPVISASRSVLYADMAGESAGGDFAAAARQAADNLRRQINDIRLVIK
jgi:hypothetical protein